MALERITTEFKKKFGGGSEPEIFFAPGRVNIIGEHLDYNGGSVFPAAIGMGITGAIRRNSSHFIRMRSGNFENEVVVDTEELISYSESSGWGNYPAGVISFLKKEGIGAGGCDIYFDSDLPDGAGLSSSACIEVLTAYMLSPDVFEVERDRVRLALMCRKVENEFIGVNCGIMDQFAVAMGRKDHAILLNTSNLEYSYVPFELKDYTLVIMNTNKPRKLSGSKFNQRREECEKAFEIISGHRNIDSLAAAKPEDVDLIEDSVLKKRARHVINENRRVHDSVPLLEKGSISEFGAMMTASHESLRNDYEVTGTELDSLVYASLDFPECAGARMTGAGFGGCAIALVSSDKIEEFTKYAESRYQNETGLKADFYPTVVSDGVGRI